LRREVIQAASSFRVFDATACEMALPPFRILSELAARSEFTTR